MNRNVTKSAILKPPENFCSRDCLTKIDKIQLQAMASLTYVLKTKNNPFEGSWNFISFLKNYESVNDDRFKINLAFSLNERFIPNRIMKQNIISN